MRSSNSFGAQSLKYGRAHKVWVLSLKQQTHIYIYIYGRALKILLAPSLYNSGELTESGRSASNNTYTYIYIYICRWTRRSFRAQLKQYIDTHITYTSKQHIYIYICMCETTLRILWRARRIYTTLVQWSWRARAFQAIFCPLRSRVLSGWRTDSHSLHHAHYKHNPEPLLAFAMRCRRCCVTFFLGSKLAVDPRHGTLTSKYKHALHKGSQWADPMGAIENFVRAGDKWGKLHIAQTAHLNMWRAGGSNKNRRWMHHVCAVQCGARMPKRAGRAVVWWWVTL